MSEATLLKVSLVLYLVGTLAGGVNLAQPGDGKRRVTTIALGLAFLTQLGALIFRALEVGTISLTGFAERGALFTCLLTGVFLLAQFRYRLSILGAVVGPIGFIGTLVALVAHGGVQDVPPGLRSPWLPIHVTLAFLGNAAFALACMVSLIYLWQERHLKAHNVNQFLRNLPSLETLDDINFRVLTWGFVLLTMSILSGVLWAELSYGRLWSWEPRTIWTSIIWLIYALLLHARVTVGWGGRRAAALTVVGFCVLFVSFIGVNVFAPGRHAISFGS